MYTEPGDSCISTYWGRISKQPAVFIVKAVGSPDLTWRAANVILHREPGANFANSRAFRDLMVDNKLAVLMSLPSLNRLNKELMFDVPKNK